MSREKTAATRRSDAAERYQEADGGQEVRADDADWEAKALPAFVGNGMRGANRYYRAAYELRYHELLALYPIS